MKKLNKIKLNEFQEMSEIEMKNVVGGMGSGLSACGSSCEGKCSLTISGKTFRGTCIITTLYDAYSGVSSNVCGCDAT